MINRKMSIPLATKISVMVLIIIIISTIPVGAFAYVIYRNGTIRDHGSRAVAIAQSLALSIDSAEFQRAIATGYKNEYYMNLQGQIDQVKSAVGTSLLFAGVANEQEGLVTFIEGLLPHDARTIDLNTVVPPEAFPPEFFYSQRHGRAVVSNVIRSWVDESHVITAYAPILDHNRVPIGVVGINIDVEDVLTYSNTFALRMLGIVIGVIAVTIWVPIFWTKHYIGRPLTLLCEASGKIAQGDITTQITYMSNDEVGELAQSFRDMQSEFCTVIDETQKMSMEIINGNLLAGRTKYLAKGDFQKIIGSINNVAGNVYQYLSDLRCHIIILDAEYRFMFINKYVMERGYVLSRMLNKTIFEVMPQSESEVLGKNLDQVRNTGGVARYQVDMISPKDEPFNTDQIIVPIRDDSGEITTYLISSYEVTDLVQAQKLAEEAAKSNEVQLAKMHLMVKATRIGLWDMVVVTADDPASLDNEFIWSDDLRSLLGYNSERDFPNLAICMFNAIHPDDRDFVLDSMRASLEDTTDELSYDIEYRVQKKKGEYAYFRDIAKITRDENGKAVHMSGAMLDVTDFRDLISEAQVQKQEAEVANTAKSAFLSTMSHEIRTPMNAILGITEIQLQNEALDPKIKEALEKIYASGDMLLGIINDILDLSKIEAGKLELQIEKYEIASLVSDTAQLNMMRIGSKPIEFDLHVDENIPTHLWGDELRVKQILNNLLSNAFKYTKSGTVNLHVFSEKCASEDERALVVSVSDTGQGMTQDQVSKLFDKYSRFNMAANRTTEGTGLGMNITRNLIEIMSGTITVESEPGKGSTFTVRLPQGYDGSAILGKEMADNLHQFRTRSRANMKRVQVSREPMPYGSVMIVDDVETNIYVAKGLMTPYELKIDSANGGYTAIEKSRAAKCSISSSWIT